MALWVQQHFIFLNFFENNLCMDTFSVKLRRIEQIPPWSTNHELNKWYGYKYFHLATGFRGIWHERFWKIWPKIAKKLDKILILNVVTNIVWLSITQVRN